MQEKAGPLPSPLPLHPPIISVSRALLRLSYAHSPGMPSMWMFAHHLPGYVNICYFCCLGADFPRYLNSEIRVLVLTPWNIYIIDPLHLLALRPRVTPRTPHSTPHPERIPPQTTSSWTAMPYPIAKQKMLINYPQPSRRSGPSCFSVNLVGCKQTQKEVEASDRTSRISP